MQLKTLKTEEAIERYSLDADTKDSTIVRIRIGEFTIESPYGLSVLAPERKKVKRLNVEAIVIPGTLEFRNSFLGDDRDEKADAWLQAIKELFAYAKFGREETEVEERDTGCCVERTRLPEYTL